MSGFIKQTVLVLVLVLLNFVGSLATVKAAAGAIKCVFLINQQQRDRSMLIDLNLDKPLYQSFSISINRRDRSCNTVDDRFGRICLPNKIKDMNLKVFNTINGINQTKNISCECNCNLDRRKCNSRQKWNNDECQYEWKLQMKYCALEEDYPWNLSACVCECDKNCEICEYLKDCEYMKSLPHALVVAFDSLQIHQKVHQSMNPSNGKIY